MNKAEMIAAVAEKTEMSKKDCEKAMTATFEVITAALEAGEKVQLVGFGERIGRNPRTKAEIKIPASRIPCFKAGKALKDAVAK